MDSFPTPALVLRTRDLDAADRLVTLLTPARGRIVCAAKNARKSFKRFGGCLNLFSEIQAEVTVREGRELGRLESAVLLEPFEDLRRGWRTLAIAATGIELVDRIAHGTEEASALYRVTRGFLRAVGAAAGDPGPGGADARALTAFELRVLAHAGFRPELLHCVVCGRGATDRKVARTFDLHRGGLLCPACAKADAGTGRGGRLLTLTDTARAALAAMLAGEPDDPAACPPKARAECAGLVNALITERLGTPLKTWSVL